ncbi:hypothetical protein [Actinacidiphila alni]|uniref:hypothetical protein n=1 Tax=Actinacidiphila alni TaxID=380248 RepID=UPI0034563792
MFTVGPGGIHLHTGTSSAAPGRTMLLVVWDCRPPGRPALCRVVGGERSGTPRPPVLQGA